VAYQFLCTLLPNEAFTNAAGPLANVSKHRSGPNGALYPRRSRLNGQSDAPRVDTVIFLRGLPVSTKLTSEIAWSGHCRLTIRVRATLTDGTSVPNSHATIRSSVHKSPTSVCTLGISARRMQTAMLGWQYAFLSPDIAFMSLTKLA